MLVKDEYGAKEVFPSPPPAAHDALIFLRKNEEKIAKIWAALKWKPHATAADVARVCYLPIETVQSLSDDYNRLGLMGHFV